MRPWCAVLAVLALASLGACEPQVVDAVTSSSGGGGVGGSGTGGTNLAGGGGTAGTGGSGGGECDPELDADSDGVPNCQDECWLQSWKVTPGACGCDFPDEEDVPGVVAACLPLRNALEHRYSFNGTSATVRDTANGRDATLVGGILPSGGSVTLGGARFGEYVDLPNHLLSALTSVTLEAWITWGGGMGQWQRVFDFGEDSSGVEDNRSGGRSYLFLTPMLPDSAIEGQFARVAYKRPDLVPEVTLTATQALPAGSPVHVAVTFDAASKTFALYIEGELDVDKVLDPATDVPMELSAINDINSWLGRSQYAQDSDFGGSIDEFRIYSVALTALQVRASKQARQDAAFLP